MYIVYLRDTFENVQVKIEPEHFSSSCFFHGSIPLHSGTIYEKSILQDTLHGASLVSLSVQRPPVSLYVRKSRQYPVSDATCIPPLSFISISISFLFHWKRAVLCSIRRSIRNKLFNVANSNLNVDSGSNIGLLVHRRPLKPRLGIDNVKGKPIEATIWGNESKPSFYVLRAI